MLTALRRLCFGLLLILGASALLLTSDLGSRSHKQPPPTTATVASTAAATPAPARKVRVALLQHASQLVLDQGREGLLAGMAERGWRVGDNVDLKFYNAHGDMPVAQTIAGEMTSGGYDILVTISTVSMQAVANANKTRHVPHVFGLVSDPYGSGVGISRENHLDHPPYMAGYGTMQPIALAFATAREMNPQLATVGVVWNAAESNSEAQVKVARKVCGELGITLRESTVDNTAGVAEATGALVARGVDAIWIGGDVTVMSAIDSVVAAAKKGGIPVFTVIPPNVKRGTLFDVGADYTEVGRLTGLLAGDILNGRSPATVAIDNIMPEVLALNRHALSGLKATWTIPEAMVQRAQLVIDEKGAEHAKTAPAAAVAAAPAVAPKVAPNPTGRKWKIALVAYNETPPVEQTLEGMKAAWKRSALVEGRDYEITFRSAQGDMAAVSGIIDAALTDRADILVPICTPALQVAVQKAKRIPIIFSLVANPMAAGAGRSYTDHLPNVTGISVLAPFEAALDLMSEHFPTYKRLGTLFCPAEANSVDLKESMEAACRKRGLTLEVVAANTATDLPDAALSLMARPIDAVLQLSDNLTSAGFTAISRAARQTKKPLLSLNSTTVPLGAAFAFGRDYHDGGEATVAMIERVIRGEDPGAMPFELPPKIVMKASQANAAAVGMTLPPALLKKVDQVTP